jgi:hypothetical protein
LSLPRKPPNVRLFFSVMGVDEKLVRQAVASLEQEYGAPACIGDIMPFDRTRYYEKEMGISLIRLFVAFKRLIEPERLPGIKLWTNELEKQFAMEDHRRVNIDPGYITAERLVLATGKNFTHRIYLGQGIYADLTLLFQQKSFHAMPWTFPDYADPKIIAFLNTVRREYLIQLREESVSA